MHYFLLIIRAHWDFPYWGVSVGIIPPPTSVAPRRLSETFHMYSKNRVVRRLIIRYTVGMMYTMEQKSSDYQMIEKAISCIEANFRQQPGLEEIARSVHLSQYHFQRLFKRWAGVSPTQFMRYLTIEYAKQKLDESCSILDAALETGLSGAGRLHDLFVAVEGMTPGEYKMQGAGLEIGYGFHDTIFGQCLLAATKRGICNLQFVNQEGKDAALNALFALWPAAVYTEAYETTGLLVDRIFDQQAEVRSKPFLLLLRGTNFQLKVWQALLSIPSGMVVTYQDIASLIGRPDATRAVANAIARNPVGYMIPCHRVIRKSGEIHGYRWGTERKKAMLAWEHAARDNA